MARLAHCRSAWAPCWSRAEGAAGVLDGRRAATHWELASQLAAAYPQVRVDGHPVFVRDGHGATSVGVSPSVYRARFRSTLGDRTR
ncbi:MULTISPECIES: type 1 glutamine amidotransferase family protein [Streptomyces violaceusniger group]|uniref:Uncharacterized protein n=2 Tax=Streptomyces rhizosphaericus TaxID=114699 RepID=A0ABP4CJ40_9ACTN